MQTYWGGVFLINTPCLLTPLRKVLRMMAVIVWGDCRVVLPDLAAFFTFESKCWRVWSPYGLLGCLQCSKTRLCI